MLSKNEEFEVDVEDNKEGVEAATVSMTVEVTVIVGNDSDFSASQGALSGNPIGVQFFFPLQEVENTASSCLCFFETYFKILLSKLCPRICNE